MVDRLKRMKETLASCMESQLGNLQSVDAKELGEVVDMVKDLEEAIYYCSITKAMEESEKKEKYKHTEHHHYTPMMQMQQPMYYRDMDRREYGRMYYPMEDIMYYRGQPRDSEGRFMESRYYGGNSGGSSSGGNGGNSGGNSRQYHEMEYPMDLRDEREGRSHMSRRMYMESKELHKDKATKIKDLEKYMKELSDDIVEMIDGASPEEKQLLEKKVASLATKIGSLSTNG